MISSGVRRNRGFISAGLLASHRKLRPRRYGSHKKQQQFQFKNIRFQLYNAVQQSWAQQINNPPILLTDDDVKNWLTFKVNKLQNNQLYFWYATKFNWIPLWATESEFLLLNFNKIKYDKVNFTQFTKASWIAKNSVKPEDVKRLLHRFQIRRMLLTKCNLL